MVVTYTKKSRVEPHRRKHVVERVVIVSGADWSQAPSPGQSQREALMLRVPKKSRAFQKAKGRRAPNCEDGGEIRTS